MGLWIPCPGFKRKLICGFSENPGPGPPIFPYAGLTSKTNNNVIERYHGTYRERDKVMRAIDNTESGKQMMDYWRTYYNFVREHSALDGLTPANAAGNLIGTSRNRWIELIERAL